MQAAALLSDPANSVSVSAATVWEIEIKRSCGRLLAPPDTIEMVRESGFDALAVSFEHAVEAAGLPLHHRDPFDRMLVAQSRLEGLTLVTADRALAEYRVPVLPVSRR